MSLLPYHPCHLPLACGLHLTNGEATIRIPPKNPEPLNRLHELHFELSREVALPVYMECLAHELISHSASTTL